jgi:hypothetical protein
MLLSGIVLFFFFWCGMFLSLLGQGEMIFRQGPSQAITPLIIPEMQLTLDAPGLIKCDHRADKVGP